MNPELSASVDELAFSQHRIVSRRQLLALGVTRWQIIAEVRARRWSARGRQAVSTHTGGLTQPATWWCAVFEAGPRSALDGVSALEAAGLAGFHSEHIRVSVPRGARVVHGKGLMVRQTRRLRPEDVIPTGLPRVRPEIAGIRAALWAVSDRQAALILAMIVQQRLTTPSALGRALLSVRRHRRRRFIESVILDLLDGAEALGELDFARVCRSYGLPAPDRQAVRNTSQGRAYLDAHWNAYRLVAEIDGIHHLEAPAVVGDALRQNDLSLAAGTVLRIPLLGLRVAEADFMRQVQAALVAGGWRRAD